MTAFTAVTVLLIALLAVVIGNLSFAPSRTFRAHFVDATGVHEGDRVRLAGVEVGRVEGVELVTSESRRVAEVSFTVREDVPVYADAELYLRYENIVGQRYLLIEERPGDRAEMRPGATFGTDQTTPALNLTELFDGFQPLFRALEPDQVNAFSYELVRALQGEAATYETLVESAASVTSDLADRDEVIGRVVDNLDELAGTVAARDEELTDLIRNFRALMSGLAQDRDVIDASLPQLADLLDSTTQTLSILRDPLDVDLAALRDVAGALSADRGALDASLQRLPRKLRALARTASYGSWFNYYACGIDLRLELLDGTVDLSSPRLPANESATVCGGGEG
ncbi:MCE family protein [Nocardioides stalactiti]|uniref:MCE family protein n=1 Tax=Nocardioides stalactiti TaxID=2755356 RepID=UPI001FE75A74|nr:MCE family protein [Nocardioides stalactiti]